MNVLTNCGTEVVGTIAEYLDGREITLLILSGCKALAYMLLRGTRQVAFTVPRFSNFPRVVFDFDQLESLTIKTPESHLYCPLNGEIGSFIPPVAHKTLKKLVFSFGQSHLLLKHTSELSSSFPGLTSLSLVGNCARTLDLQHFRDLSRQLLKFELRPPLWLLLSSEAISLLPPSLKELSMKVLLGDQDHIQRHWPKTLEVLNIGEMSSLLFRVLPSSLNRLTLHSKHDRELVWIHGYPAGLTSLTVSAPLHVGPVQNKKIIVLPQSLTYLHATHMMRPFSRARMDLKSIPPSLTQLNGLETNFDSLDSRPLNTILPNLTELRLPPDASLTPQIENCSSLPRILKSLHCQGGINLPGLENLPSSITSLSIPITHESHFQWLPRVLLSLEVTNWNSDLEPFSIEAWNKVPRSLTSLMTHTARLDSFEALSSLTNLLTLRLWTSSPNRVDSCVTFGPLIPPRLKKLYFGGRGPPPRLISTWLCQLTHMENLEHITLDYHRRSLDEAPYFTHEWTSQIPRGLKHLRFPIGEDFVKHTNYLYNIPRGLLSLSLDSRRDQGNQGSTLPLQDAHFAQLPQTLTHLQIPEKHSGLSDEFLSLIPQGIVTFEGFSFSHTQLRHYYSARIWNECCPPLPKEQVFML